LRNIIAVAVGVVLGSSLKGGRREGGSASRGTGMVMLLLLLLLLVLLDDGADKDAVVAGMCGKDRGWLHGLVCKVYSITSLSFLSEEGEGGQELRVEGRLVKKEKEKKRTMGRSWIANGKNTKEKQVLPQMQCSILQ